MDTRLGSDKMKKIIAILGIVTLMTIGISGCTSLKDDDKFYGTWTAGAVTVQFLNTHMVNVTGGDLVAIGLPAGDYTWQTSSDPLVSEITFTPVFSGGLTVPYEFVTTNQLVFAGQNESVTLTSA